MYDFERLRVFLEIVRHKSFAKAARHLNQPTTTVSRKLKTLEAEVGAILIRRSTRSLSLTELGEKFRPKAEAVIAAYQDLSDEVEQNNRAPSGTLNISGPPAILLKLAADLSAFSQHYPEVSLQLDSSSQNRNLVEHQLDFVFRSGPLVNSALIARLIDDIEFSLVASPTFLANRAPPKDPKDVAQWHSIRTYIDGVLTPWSMSHKDRVEILDPVPLIKTDDLLLAREFAILGSGIALLPKSLVQPCLDSGVLQCVFPDWAPLSRPLYLVYQEKSYLPPKCRAFIDFFSKGKSG